MGVYFSGDELIRIAVGIEKSGYAFYMAAAQACADQSCKSVYRFLASEEKRHEEAFIKMSESGAMPKLEEGYEGEYDAYLKVLVASLVFRDEKEARRLGQKTGEAEAVAIGIRAEKDSILFYESIQALVRDRDKAVVAGIVQEERRHLARLTALSESVSSLRK